MPNRNSWLYGSAIRPKRVKTALCEPSLSQPLLLSLCKILALISCYKYTYPDSAVYLLLVSPYGAPIFFFFLSDCHQTQISDSDLEEKRYLSPRGNWEDRTVNILSLVTRKKILNTI